MNHADWTRVPTLAGTHARLEPLQMSHIDGLRGALGAPNFELLNQRAEVITVDDVDTVTAMRRVWQVMKQVVEPSSAITLAAVLAQPERFAGRNVGLIFSGGNVDLDALPWGKE